jgi:tetratricopeptide (TPR) repeat protein
VNEKRYADAIAIYERALRAQPDKAEIHVGLALLHAGTHQRAKAARAFARAGELFLETSRPEQALEALRRARRLLPADAEIGKRLRRAEQALRKSSDE